MVHVFELEDGDEGGGGYDEYGFDGFEVRKFVVFDEDEVGEWYEGSG